MNLSYEEESFLLEEKIQCAKEIKELQTRLWGALQLKNRLENKIINVHLRHNEADRKLAMANKLTIVGKAKRKSKEKDSMEELLKNPAKLAELIGLLEGVKDDR